MVNNIRPQARSNSNVTTAFKYGVYFVLLGHESPKFVVKCGQRLVGRPFKKVIAVCPVGNSLIVASLTATNCTVVLRSHGNQ